MELQAEALTCSRGGREVFRNVSFKVPAGEALIVTGRNGAGKSSLLRMIAGLVGIAAGRLSLSGGKTDTPIAEQAHYLGHQDAMKASLTVAENLQFWTRFFGSRSDFRPALELLDLAPLADLPAAYLSAGQRRRLSVARIVAVSRPVWLLDEPTAALDTPSQTRLSEIMRGHLAGGGIIIAAAHGAIGLERARELRLGAA
ncbi:MAG TPA: heme ABC exporter ATP-binding protein CcmA [Pseudolabrys sp.]|nr:heme ABC exporter ATP-binding protein CcmA [Pseudolabrys sp.]